MNTVGFNGKKAKSSKKEKGFVKKKVVEDIVISFFMGFGSLLFFLINLNGFINSSFIILVFGV